MTAQWQHFGQLAKGGALALCLLWFALSFAPLIDLYRSISDAAWWLNVVFVLTSIPVLLSTYVLIRFLAVAPAKTGVDRWVRGHLPHIAAFGALWITVYALVI